MFKLLTYNIRKEKYAGSLRASGASNRWNKEGEYVIYSGSSRALSVLELVVHRAGINPDQSYKLLTIEIDAKQEDIEDVKNLPENWHFISNYSQLQEMGSTWYKSCRKLLLKVPSAVIQREYNYIINTQHPKFNTYVRVKETEDFEWDKRLL